ncbi:hypothetical protein ACFQVC_34035 [Streptomyces monticola]|uniref:Aspartate transcarbamylase n=1 Tax=Streptomyces monticola TaxID=2666263 RepID=A0ABW2JU91_9ACTN
MGRQDGRGRLVVAAMTTVSTATPTAPASRTAPYGQRPRHATTLSDWSEQDLEALYDRAQWMLTQPRDTVARTAPGMLLGTLFYQNSTRSRISFETAAHRIGGASVGFSDVTTTRAGDFYAESLEDTVRVIGGYTDALVLRHTDDDAARRAAAVSPVPLISAGTGDQEHPTQVMLDLWVIRSALGAGLRGATLGYVGDPTCRVARSLVYALRSFKAAGLVFLTPDGARFPADVVAAMESGGLAWRTVESAGELLSSVDAACIVPFELSDFHQSAVRSHQRRDRLDERFVFSRELLTGVGAGVPVTHTGPRGPELPGDVDELANVHYLDGVAKGVPLRSALLAELLAHR